MPHPALLALALAAADPPLVSFVAVQAGTIPVIISAPHGGRRLIPNVPDRRGAGVKQFVTVRDTYTQELAVEVSAALNREFGGQPFAAVAHFDRRQVDANRPPEAAYEDPAAAPHYDAYHAALKSHCAAVQKTWGRGLLLDLHGHAADRAVTFRGTRNGTTVKSLTARFGRQALVGSDSVLGALAAGGWAVHPPVGAADDPNIKEDPRYGGGHIVHTYGSDAGTGVDAIQLELGGDLRSPRRLKRTAADLAAAVKRFADVYLPGKDERRPGR